MKVESFNLIRPGGGRGHMTIMCLTDRTTLLFMDNSTDCTGTALHRPVNQIELEVLQLLTQIVVVMLKILEIVFIFYKLYVVET